MNHETTHRQSSWQPNQIPQHTATSSAKVQNSVYDLVQMGPKPKIEQDKKFRWKYSCKRSRRAYCAQMRKKRGSGRGKQTFNDDGTLFKRKPKDLTQR
jgi:hypothetical protein